MIKATAYCTAVLLLCTARFLTAADPTAAEKQAIVALDEQYVKAFNAGNVDAAMQTFADDAEYFTDDGRTLHGKQELKQALEEQFKEKGRGQLKLNVYSIDVAADRKSAIERGVSIVTTEGVQEPSSYEAKFTRVGDQWRVSQVKESAQAPSAEHLQSLAWMIGDWTDQGDQGSIRAKTTWGLDRGFIVRRFAIAGEKGLRDLKGTEYIGWDPVHKEIHSWYFDSDGGYGSGRWKQDGNRWVVESTGITQNGETASATQTITPKNDKSFTVQATNRQIGGQPQENSPEITMQRMESAQSDAAKEPL
jgi:uncharacterized protein (TIGR02246 family)